MAQIGMCFDRSFPTGELPGHARRLEASGVDQLWVIEDCFALEAAGVTGVNVFPGPELEIAGEQLPLVADLAARAR